MALTNDALTKQDIKIGWIFHNTHTSGCLQLSTTGQPLRHFLAFNFSLIRNWNILFGNSKGSKAFDAIRRRSVMLFDFGTIIRRFQGHTKGHEHAIFRIVVGDMNGRDPYGIRVQGPGRTKHVRWFIESIRNKFSNLIHDQDGTSLKDVSIGSLNQIQDASGDAFFRQMSNMTQKQTKHQSIGIVSKRQNLHNPRFQTRNIFGT
mmetsp:Transcript_63012/g.181252  ORF Transcript_63012/g.181252 Transcript_63012/m.181252 type:complete len:204 (+) Transcript_63012:116-727(+)